MGEGCDSPVSKQAELPPLPTTSRSHQKRRRARDKAAAEVGQYPRASTLRRYVATSDPIPTKLVTEDLPVAAGGYSAKNGQAPGAKKPSLVEHLLENQGFDYVPWNG